MLFSNHCLNQWWPVVPVKLMRSVAPRNAENSIKTTAQVGPTEAQPPRYAAGFVLTATVGTEREIANAS